jgi:hypothetical protein
MPYARDVDEEVGRRVVIPRRNAATIFRYLSRMLPTDPPTDNVNGCQGPCADLRAKHVGLRTSFVLATSSAHLHLALSLGFHRRSRIPDALGDCDEALYYITWHAGGARFAISSHLAVSSLHAQHAVLPRSWSRCSAFAHRQCGHHSRVPVFDVEVW